MKYRGVGVKNVNEDRHQQEQYSSYMLATAYISHRQGSRSLLRKVFVQLHYENHHDGHASRLQLNLSSSQA